MFTHPMQAGLPVSRRTARAGALSLLLGALALGGLALPGRADVCASLQSGAWGNSATWSCGHPPTANSDVVINTGHQVFVGGSVAVHYLEIRGEIVAAPNTTINVSGDCIFASIGQPGSAHYRMTGAGQPTRSFGSLQARNFSKVSVETDPAVETYIFLSGSQVQTLSVQSGRAFLGNYGVAHDLDIGNAGVLELVANLDCGGDLTKAANATFTHSNGELKLTGAADQHISGSFVFKSLTIEQATPLTKVTSDQPLEVLDTLTVKEGKYVVVSGTKLTAVNIQDGGALELDPAGPPNKKLEVLGGITKSAGGQFLDHGGTIVLTPLAGTIQKIQSPLTVTNLEFKGAGLSTAQTTAPITVTGATTIDAPLAVFAPAAGSQFASITVKNGSLAPPAGDGISISQSLVKQGGGQITNNGGRLEFPPAAAPQTVALHGASQIAAQINNSLGIAASNTASQTNAGQARIQVCDGQTVSLPPGASANVQCGSLIVDVLAGTATLEPSKTVRVEAAAGAGVTTHADQPGVAAVENRTGGGAAVVIGDGNSAMLPAGSTLGIEESQSGAATLTNLAGAANITVQTPEGPVPLAPGQSTTATYPVFELTHSRIVRRSLPTQAHDEAAATVQVRNAGTRAAGAPDALWLVVESVSIPFVTVTNADGQIDGRPAFDLTPYLNGDGTLDINETSARLTIRFLTPYRQPFDFQTRIVFQKP